MAMTTARKIEKAYETAMKSDRQIAAIEAAAREGTATLKDAGIYASKAGGRAGDAMAEWLQDLVTESDDDIRAVVKDILRRGYDDVSPIIEAAVTNMNNAAGLKLKAILADFDDAKADGLAQMIAEADDAAALSGQLHDLAENFVRSQVDISVRRNAEFQAGSGLEVRVVRTYDGKGLHGKGEDCEWCLERCGEWSFDDALANGVFERHTGCGCEIGYTSRKTGTRGR